MDLEKERNTSCGRPGQSEGNSCLDEPPRLASGPGDCGSTQRKDGRSVAHGLEFLYRACSHASLSFGLHAVQVAWLVGLRNGCLGDMACHTTNLAFMACELTQPSLIESVNTGPINDETFPSWASINLHFPKCDKHGAIKFHWYEGKVGNNGKDNKGIKNLPPMELFHGQNPKNSGLLIVGSDGIMYSTNDYGADWMFHKGGKWHKRNEVELPDQSIPRNGRGDNGMKE